MKKRKDLGMRVKRFLADWGASIAYLVVCLGACMFYSRSVPFSPPVEKKDVASVVLESLSNTVTIVAGIADFIVAMILCLTKKDAPKKDIILLSATFFLLILFDSFAIRFPLSSAWIVLVNCFFFVLSTSILLIRFLNKQVKLEEKKSEVIGSIKHKKIAAEQLFSFVRSVDGKDVTYTLKSIEHKLRMGHDVNGILSVTYRIPCEEDSTFSMILQTYFSLESEGTDETKENLIATLRREKDKLTKRLQAINSADCVTPEDCCIARILMIYLAFLQMLSPSEEQQNTWYGGENYIGELSFDEGWLGIDVEIEKRLFTLLRTGLLGAVLLGPDLRYFFSYRNGGYKQGRRYSATCLPANDDNTNKVILFALDNIPEKTVPQYITNALHREEIRVTELLRELEGA